MTCVRLSRVTNYQLLPTATNQNGRQTGGHFCVQQEEGHPPPKSRVSGEIGGGLITEGTRIVLAS